MSRHAALHSESNPHHQYPGITKVLSELDKENFRLKKLLPKALDVVLPFAAACRVRFFESGNYSAYTAMSEDGSRTVQMQTSRIPESGTFGPAPGVWYGHEQRLDAMGHAWERRMGDHVCDDFGMLVPVPPMRSVTGVQS